jgi:hypothetical protein
MKRTALFVPVVLALLLTGCTHMTKLNLTPVERKEPTAAQKGTATLAAIQDRRDTQKPLFRFSNWPHKWIFEGDKQPAEMIRALITEGLRRRGIEVSGTGAPMSISVEILEFAGANEPGAFYSGTCDYKISTAIKIAGPAGEKSFTVSGTAQDHWGRVNKSNVLYLMNLAYNDFLQKLDEELVKAGF